ncbi:hypothetical protein KCP77_10315 [Salmonella enterica subsp. enterica]|nr:hypothetical protein KCP77_10315 [Salmonella enterica subsp. enterica]
MSAKSSPRSARKNGHFILRCARPSISRDYLATVVAFGSAQRVLNDNPAGNAAGCFYT